MFYAVTYTWFGFNYLDTSGVPGRIFHSKKYAWPSILGGLRKREQTIADSLATAEKIKAEMAQMKNENEPYLQKQEKKGPRC
jgi:F0F1-type ATP synthase membrane subunit b/b'